MNIVQNNIAVCDDTFSLDEMVILANDPNCKRSYLGKTLEEIVTSGTTWHRIKKNGVWAGAFLLDAPEEGMVCQHICALDGSLTRAEAIIATQLSVKISIIRELLPYTTVSQDPSYDYMRKFLEDCGFVRNRMDHRNVDVYVVPEFERYNILHKEDFSKEYQDEQG